MADDGPREIDRPRIERAVREILLAIGEDPAREGLVETPERVAEAYAQLFSGVHEDPTRQLEVSFSEEARDAVLMRDIPLVSFCVPSRQNVNTVGGAKRAADVVVGDEFWTLDRGFLQKTRVTRTTSRKTHDVVEVRTTGGVIRVTGDHPIKVDGGWCEAGKLRPGDRVEWFPPRKLCRRRVVATPGFHLGYLLGAVASEGSIQDGRRISVVVSDTAFAGRIAAAWREAFCVDAAVERIEVDSGFLKRKIPMCRVRVVSSDAATKISRWLGIPKDCKDKTRGFSFPKVVTSSPEMMQGFLGGYIDGDGTRRKTGSEIITANIRFAEELGEYLRVSVRKPREGIYYLYVPDRWREPGWKTKHGFRQETEWYNPMDSEYVEVVSVGLTPKSTKPTVVYSFKCEPHPTFLVGGHLTHNCEHHLLPMVGRVHVGYAPNERVVGFSEIVRLTQGYARRPQLQERLTAQIADALHGDLGSHGSFVVVEATQLCMVAQGAQGDETVAITTADRGVYKEDAALRAEVLSLVSRG